MSGRSDPTRLLRVERGHAEPEELAALAVLLLVRAAAQRRAERLPSHNHSPVGWHRLVRIPDFRAPHSWRI
ncbi:acyl-CoA carboxylase epsilon subunit [Streptomyces olivaceus]|uniref:acyl-CoA carboxylase epsilon subunit n=1 Tax=Streptomyces olivaceus TaxID=47716 RepID=UPI00382414B3